MKEMFSTFAIATVLGVAAILLAEPPATQPAATTEPAATTRPSKDPTVVNLKQMGLFFIDQANGKIEDVPQRFRDLGGDHVTFICDMWAPQPDNTHPLTSFQACYSRTKWSFRGAPLVQDFWDCHVPEGLTVRYGDGAYRVTGVLHVRIRRSTATRITSIYDVDVERVEPL